MRIDRKLGNPCQDCLLDCFKIKTVGKRDARFLVVTKAPSNRNQVRDNNHLNARAKKIFARNAVAAGFTGADFVFHAGIQCEFDEKSMIAKDRHVVEQQCRELLFRVIDKMKPDVIIPLGAQAVKQVTGRPAKITKVRGIPQYSRELDTIILPMLDPDIVSIQEHYEQILAVDLQTLANLVEEEYDIDALEARAFGEYEMVTDLQFMVDRSPDLVVIDTEDTGLRWQETDAKVLTIQVTDQEGKGWLVPWDHPEYVLPARTRSKIRRQLRELLCRPEVRVVGHHCKFDAHWFREKLNIDVRIADDTLMMIATLDENLLNKDLSTLTKIYVPEMAGYDDAFNSKYDKSRMDLVPLAEIVNYGCGDVDATLRLFNILEQQLMADRKLYRNYRFVSMPGINGFKTVEQDGMLVHEPGLDALETVVARGQAEAYRSLIAQVPRAIKREHAEAGLEFSRADFIRDILFDHPAGFNLTPKVFTESTEKLADHLKKASTSTKDHLPYFYDDCPFTQELSTYIKNERLLGTNIRRFRENYMYNGKIFPVYSLWTAVTGRSASRDPNGQNFPKRGEYAKAYRSIFKPPEGYVLLEADLSQAELRIAGDMARDRVITRIYAEDGDIHTMTACMVMGVTMREFSQLPAEERSLARFKAKAVNFGFIYGMGWRKFIGYAKTQYGVEFTEREAQRIRAGYFNLYPGLEPWHAAMREYAREHGYVRSYSGRIRHLPMIKSHDDYTRMEAERQAINSPVQEFASTLGVMAMSRITHEIDQDLLKIVGFVHDALYAYVRAEHVLWGAQTLKWYMESNPLKEWFNCDMTDRVPIKADVSFGPHGGKTYEMAGLTTTGPFDFRAIEGLEMDLPEQVEPENDGVLLVPEYLDSYELAYAMA